jgi:hypothetical protein
LWKLVEFSTRRATDRERILRTDLSVLTLVVLELLRKPVSVR